MGYAKKRKKNGPAKRNERKIMHAKEHEEKKMKRKERNKDNPYLQIKGIHSKRERFMIQRSTQNI